MRRAGGYFTRRFHGFFKNRVVCFQREALGNEINSGGGYAGELSDACFHGITPQSVKSTVQALLKITNDFTAPGQEEMSEDERQELLKSLEDQMLSAAKGLDFEKAAKLRDQLFSLKGETKNVQKPQMKRRRMKKPHR